MVFRPAARGAARVYRGQWQTVRDGQGDGLPVCSPIPPRRRWRGLCQSRLIRLLVPPQPSRNPARGNGEKTMTIINFILLLNALAQLLGNLANLTTALMRYAELRRWRRRTLRGLKHRRRC